MSAEKYAMVLRQVLQAADGLLPPRPSHWLGRPSSDACFVPRAVEPVEMTITPSRSDQVPLFVQQFFMQVRHRGSRQTKRGRGGRDQHRNAPTRVADEPVTETCCNSGFPIPGEQRTRNAIAARSRAQTGYGLVEKSAMLGDRRAVRPRQKGLVVTVRTWGGLHWLLRHPFHHRSDPHGYVIVTGEGKKESDNASATPAVESHPSSILEADCVRTAHKTQTARQRRHRSDSRVSPCGDRAWLSNEAGMSSWVLPGGERRERLTPTSKTRTGCG